MKHLKTLELFNYKLKKKIKELDLDKYILYSSDNKVMFLLEIYKIDKEYDNFMKKDDIGVSVIILYKYEDSFDKPEKMNNNNKIEEEYLNIKKGLLFKSNNLKECLDIMPCLFDKNNFNI